MKDCNWYTDIIEETIRIEEASRSALRMATEVETTDAITVTVLQLIHGTVGIILENLIQRANSEEGWTEDNLLHLSRQRLEEYRKIKNLPILTELDEYERRWWKTHIRAAGQQIEDCSFHGAAIDPQCTECRASINAWRESKKLEVSPPEKLSKEATQEAHRRHAQHYLERGREAYRREAVGLTNQSSIEKFEALEGGNIRKAAEWARDHDIKMFEEFVAVFPSLADYQQADGRD